MLSNGRPLQHAILHHDRIITARSQVLFHPLIHFFLFALFEHTVALSAAQSVHPGDIIYESIQLLSKIFMLNFTMLANTQWELLKDNTKRHSRPLLASRYFVSCVPFYNLI